MAKCNAHCSGFCSNGNRTVPTTIQYTESGELDTSYNGVGYYQHDFGYWGCPYAAVIQNDGSIVLGGGLRVTTDSPYGFATYVERYTVDGTPDMTFGTEGVTQSAARYTSTNANAYPSFFDAAVQADGKIVMVGGYGDASNNILVARYGSDGTPDVTFATSGELTYALPYLSAGYRVAILPDGRILVAGIQGVDSSGSAYNVFYMRLTEAGALDTTFGSGGFATLQEGSDHRVTALKALPDGKLLVAFQIKSASGYWTPYVARFDGDFVPDDSFGTAGFVPISLGGLDVGSAGLVVQSDGKIVTGGCYNEAGQDKVWLARLSY